MRSLDETAPHFSCIAGSIFYFTACTQQENTPAENVENTTAVNEESISPNSKPQLMRLINRFWMKNTDVPAEIANAPADAATVDQFVSGASEPMTP